MNVIIVDDLFEGKSYYHKIGFHVNQNKMVYPENTQVFTLERGILRYREPKEIFSTLYVDSIEEARKKFENILTPIEVTSNYFIGTDDYSKKWKFQQKDYFHWKQVASISIGHSHKSVYYQGDIYSFYGADIFHFSDHIQKFNTKTHKIESINTLENRPGGRNHQSCEIYGDNVIFFGGFDREFKNDLWIFNLSKIEWRQIKGDLVPSERRYHSSVIAGDQMYIFGGEHRFDQHINDLWVFDCKNLKWKELNKSNIAPDPRRYSSLVHIDSRLYLFAGRDDDKRMNDLWEYDLLKNQWNQLKCNGDVPKERSGHCAIAYKSSMFICGGNNGDQPLELDFYEYNTVTKMWKMIVTTGTIMGRYWHQCNLIDDYIYLSKGKTDEEEVFGDVWRMRLPLPITTTSIQNMIYLKKENFTDVEILF